MTATLSPQQGARVASLWLDTESHRAAELVLPHIGNPSRFPRDLAAVAMLHFPIQIKQIPGLTLGAANNWFLARGSARAFDGENRPLHGCCFIDKGHGTLFVDANDAPDEKRFTIAHEFAHFLLDHHLPRLAALKFFGDDILPVLDGVRPATIIERFRSVRMQLPIGAVTNLMERARDAGAAYEISSIEARADRLALALLAPADLVLADLPAISYESQLALVSTRLHEVFGLPDQVAALYADALLLALGRAPARFARRPQP